MTIRISNKCLKARKENFVIYDVDYLLSHLAGEIALLWESKQHKVNAFDKAEFDERFCKGKEQE